MYSIKGECHCGNISYLAVVPNKLSTYTPRICDCYFCTTHNIAYVSDCDGTLAINIKHPKLIHKVRQNNGLVDFFLCNICQVITNACYEENGHIYSSVNVNTTKQPLHFGNSTTIHVTNLSAKDKVKRWKNIWFKQVSITLQAKSVL